jgi:hypothetical protein
MIAGTDQAAPATTVRRVTPRPLLPGFLVFFSLIPEDSSG